MIPDTSPRARQSARIWRRVTRLDAASASGWYALLTLVLTWPICANLTTRLPSDLGDPLFASWLLQWNIDHLLALARGDLGAIGRYWNAGIFHPEPLALLYAEHLFALGVQALPVWLATGNLLLCYNLLVLSTFVLSGLGTFLLVRDLTGNPRAAFVAGLFYAFAPYRFAQLGHIQVLSSQWMPFALFGLRRFFDRMSGTGSGRRGGDSAAVGRSPSATWPLAGGALALVAQNLSCGYYMVFFAPVVIAYVLWEVATRRLWLSARTWAALAVAGTAVTGACLPFLLKYRELRLRGFASRSVDELRAYSADTSAYLRGIQEMWLWPEGFTSYNRAEGQLFPGLTPVFLAVFALACLAAALRRRSSGAAALSGWRLAVCAPVTLAGIAALDLARFELFAGRWIWRIRETWPWLSNIHHVFLVIAASGVVLLALAPRARAAFRLGLSSGRAFFAVLFLLAVWLSFGPVVTTWEHGIAADTLYTWFYRHVPGFDGLRVPARYGMLAMLFLAVLGGYGAAAVDAAAKAWREGPPPRGRRFATHVFGVRRMVGPWLVPILGAFFVLEVASMPQRVTAIEWERRDGVPGRVSAAELERLYGFIRRMPRGTVVVEFPFGDLLAETRAVYLSTRHGHPILNGYSGGFPASYSQRLSLLMDPIASGDAAWQSILESGATCLVVHQWAFEGTGPALSTWLQSHGAIPLATFKSDRLFKVPR